MGSGKGNTKRVSTTANDKPKALAGSSRIIKNAKGMTEGNAARIAKLGNWPENISPQSLLARIPNEHETAPGFDAGIACALDLIPRDRQKLSASLHAAYTPELIDQVTNETKTWDPDSESVWWLAACGVCEEGGVKTRDFVEQIQDFTSLANDPAKRLEVAKQTYDEMLNSFELDEDGMPFAKKDGGMQGAYLAGHKVAAMYAENYSLYFIGTINPTLHLENFDWESDEEHSGPVHGSKQFVKCSSKKEYKRVVRHLFEDDGCHYYDN